MKQETISAPALGSITIDLLTSIEKYLGESPLVSYGNYFSQAVNKVFADSSNAAHWYVLAEKISNSDLAWQCYSMSVWLDSDSFKYKLGLFTATLKLGSLEQSFVQFNNFCTKIHNDNDRAELAGIFACYLMKNDGFEQAVKLISGLNQDNKNLSKVRLDIGLILLEKNQPVKAIEVMEPIHVINLENEHYIIKRSAALISAYRLTDQHEAEQREWYFLQNFMFPSFMWQYEEMWGDTAKLLNKSPIYDLRH